MSAILFSTIDVSRQVFYRSSLSYACVNLKPIVPGHVLVIPNRPVPRIADLNASELASLMISVQRVGSVLERAYGAHGLTVACQDGKAAGQSIPHVHFHLLPRRLAGDRFSGDRNDEIYPALEHAETELRGAAEETNKGRERLRVDADENRKPRSKEEMEEEAKWLMGFFEDESEDSKAC
ncbi:diadenosine tetraphosphate asymmetrical hydrolase [Punctularia strigosozonata HHB-11173 SS5]|uniref:diadenosine tetraphosphate asymmetrical hydrolase n=1 Tax=Punctularia strigosozonata (strain HHB-11173) TaxID=741275 RepID=UPI000441662E|nr:diadenosine tetraphosphate asymmetrical hydrolase [Punctularia strigosozonata HHB-11173 SS5]EIN13858.1 diadenosine tetraphosphate asymmetrical hydrolase [Punctularia strigosozonata HHB-11173 SS5]